MKEQTIKQLHRRSKNYNKEEKREIMNLGEDLKENSTISIITFHEQRLERS